MLCSHYGDWVPVAIVCDKSLTLIGVGSQQMFKMWTEEAGNVRPTLGSFPNFMLSCILTLRVCTPPGVRRCYTLSVDGLLWQY